MKLIVGLGNPGSKYEGTRHNVGFDVLGLLATRWSAEVPRSRFDSLVAECVINQQKTLLIRPQTYMNRSGHAVQQAASFFKTPLENLLIVCDDFNLPLGMLRFRSQGSSGGQNGLKDVIRALGGAEPQRLRIGVGPVPDQWDAADFVLGRFGRDERDQAEASVERAADSVETWVVAGITEAMNRYN
ncbi:MAG: aminoacyl-tRNA hydrolase [Planctomycetales bacterium]|nr:aminoacyl-tRNA hydrolase [Planctomycetales bacterium]